MSLGIQLLSFFISFLYGVFIYIVTKYHKKYLNNKNILYITNISPVRQFVVSSRDIRMAATATTEINNKDSLQ